MTMPEPAPGQADAVEPIGRLARHEPESDQQGRAADPTRAAALAAIEGALAELGLDWSRSGETFTVGLPGTHKLRTACVLDVGRHTVQVRAFVARRPEQDVEVVHRWLLERNLKLAGVAFCLDHLGDIYLIGRVPVARVDVALVDALLGAVAEAADSSFDSIVALGFADSIRREWAWRRSRGESTANLAAFTALDPQQAPS